jgi:hypothetical protein
LGDQRRPGAHPRRGGGRLATGMATTDNDHIEAAVHRTLQSSRRSTERKTTGQKAVGAGRFT